jgi:hypothetical protein
MTTVGSTPEQRRTVDKMAVTALPAMNQSSGRMRMFL